MGISLVNPLELSTPLLHKELKKMIKFTLLNLIKVCNLLSLILLSCVYAISAKQIYSDNQCNILTSADCAYQ